MNEPKKRVVRRRVNKVTTRQLEEQIARCQALRDWDGAAALIRLGKLIDAPLSKSAIDRFEKQFRAIKQAKHIPDHGYERCPDCQGTGIMDGFECALCEGDGQVKEL